MLQTKELGLAKQQQLNPFGVKAVMCQHDTFKTCQAAKSIDGMSIEDGYWLAQMLGEPGILGQPERLALALREYESKRAPYTARIVHEARMLMRALHPTRRVVNKSLNAAWYSGVVGKLVARKFVAVFQQGLSETEWSASERSVGQLEL